MSDAHIGNTIVTHARVSVPSWGLWWADVRLAESVSLSGSQTLVIGDTSFVGSIVAGGMAPEDSTSGYRMVGGAGGWGTAVSAKSYANDLGVRADLVLGDVAADAGETISGEPTTRLGPHYARAAAPASRVINDILPRGWYVGFDGVTYCTTRSATTYDGSGVLVRIDRERQILEYQTEALAGLVPGVSRGSDHPAASDVEYELTPDRLVARLYLSDAGKSRRLSALERVVLALFPRIPYLGLHEFRVVTQSTDRFDLQPVRSTLLGDLSNVPVRPGMAGLRADVTPGEQVLVAFIGGDPSRPAIVAHEAPDVTGWMPTLLELGGPGALGVVRLGDTVQAGPYAGVTTGSSARVKAVT